MRRRPTRPPLSAPRFPVHVKLSESPEPPLQVSIKRCQPFIRTHNEPLSVAAMRIGNEDCWPAGRDHIMISALVS
jgi:hypothetical protein